VDAFLCSAACRKRRSRKLKLHEQYRQLDSKIEAARERGRKLLRDLASSAEREGRIDEVLGVAQQKGGR